MHKQQHASKTHFTKLPPSLTSKSITATSTPREPDCIDLVESVAESRRIKLVDGGHIDAGSAAIVVSLLSLSD